MLETIFVSAATALCDAKSWAPYVCAVGSARNTTWREKEAYAPEGVPDDHWLLANTDWWATGVLIHERVVLSVAHAPRSTSIMGDRVLLPRMDGDDLPQRILRVKRLVDHPFAQDPAKKGYDLRLFVLHYDACDDPTTGASDAKVRDEANRRKAQLEPYVEGRDFVLHGFRDLHWSVEQKRLAYTLRHRRAEPAEDADKVALHGHSPSREFVLTPCPCRSKDGTPSPTAAFGDSGTPVSERGAPSPRVVGMYARRSINRAASENPDLVVIKVTPALLSCLSEILSRHGIQGAFATPAANEEPAQAQVAKR